MDPKKTKIIVGPPGTGKTTRLLDVVEDYFFSGMAPDRICLVAFTRKAAQEARVRAMDKFGFGNEELIYFRTLHSLAFQQLQMTRSEVMGRKDYAALAGILGISITLNRMSEDGLISGLSKGDRLLFMEGLARSRQIPLKDLWESMPDEDVIWEELDRLSIALKEYKDVNEKWDFIDMIDVFIRREMTLDIDVLIVDEAQDLSKVQWSMIDLLGRGAREIYVAGDDDQAIFRWAGADVDTFISLEGDVTTLSKSYRVPTEVQAIANTVISRVSVRRKKRWSAREGDEGSVEFHINLDEIDMSEGTWLLLGRNMYLLDQYNEHCLQNGYIFDSLRGSPIRGPAIGAIRTWENLRRGKKATAAQVRKVYDLMSVKVSVRYGAKGLIDRERQDKYLTYHELRRDYGLATDKPWFEALDRLNPTEREYFRAALRRGERPLAEPRIKISTIHGVKGGEADHVVIFTDMAHRTYQEYLENPDDEYRVWYVAMTRAKRSLHIIQPMSQRYFET